MNPIFEAAHEVERACRAEGFSFCFIGGLAVQRWGEPRMTADVDLTLITGFGGEFVDALLKAFRGRPPDTRTFALDNRTLLLFAANGTPIDVSLSAMPFEERAVERSSGFDVGGGVVLTTCSAEDLVVRRSSTRSCGATARGRRTRTCSTASSARSTRRRGSSTRTRRARAS